MPRRTEVTPGRLARQAAADRNRSWRRRQRRASTTDDRQQDSATASREARNALLNRNRSQRLDSSQQQAPNRREQRRAAGDELPTPEDALRTPRGRQRDHRQRLRAEISPRHILYRRSIWRAR